VGSGKNRHAPQLKHYPLQLVSANCNEIKATKTATRHN
jgi:hypothetical protein